MDANTRIGFCYSASKRYCKKCNHIFSYGYNGITGLQKGNCPKCGAGKNYEDIVREEDIDVRIMMLRSLIRSDSISDEQRLGLRKEVSDLNKIRRLFDDYDRDHQRHD